jgi:hypothetical protein
LRRLFSRKYASTPTPGKVSRRPSLDLRSRWAYRIGECPERDPRNQLQTRLLVLHDRVLEGLRLRVPRMTVSEGVAAEFMSLHQEQV